MHPHAAVLGFLGAYATRVAAQTASPTATIDSGPLIGRATSPPDSSVTVNQFLGIPFAEAPVQDLRFRPPQNISEWETPLEVQEQPNACRQWLGPPGEARDRRIALFYDESLLGQEDEDCLYLNVYAPEGGESDKSVLFWIHGGSGFNGAISMPMYDGTGFAANHDLVVVAPNYRLNVFGNPTAPQLDPEERTLAQLDMRLALDWTRRNVAAFGGDPGKVTIMGESAGAIGVGNLINTYPENPPFRAGVLMSGSSVAAPQGVRDVDTTTEEWAALMALLNCTGTSSEEELECARAADADLIVESLHDSGLQFGDAPPDNVTVLGRPDLAWADGNVAQVPILIGSTADDGSVFILGELQDTDESIVNNLSVGDAFRLMENDSDDLASALDQVYQPGSRFAEGANTTWALLSQVATDYTFRCTSTFVANLTASLLRQPTWQYLFDAVVPSNTWPEWPELGAYHASEIPLVFGTYPRDNTTAAETALSRSLQKQFADFVKDPQGGPGWEEWPTIAVLGVNSTGPTVTSEDASELDEVCLFYYPEYLSTLPALEALGGDLGDAETDSESESEPESSSAEAISAVQGGFNAIVAVMCMVAVLSVAA